MRYKVRNGVFETNSSSTHSLVVVKDGFDMENLSSVLWDYQHECDGEQRWGYEGAGVESFIKGVSYISYLRRLSNILDRFEEWDENGDRYIDWDEMAKEGYNTERLKHIPTYEEFYKIMSECEELKRVVHVDMDNNMHAAYRYLHNEVADNDAYEVAAKKCKELFGVEVDDMMDDSWY